MKIGKGDRVEVTAKNGEVLTGTVIRGGRSVTAVVDGSETQVKAPAACFRRSDQPLPVSPPSVMDKWGVEGYRRIPGHGDTPTFHAKITLYGNVVGEAMNDGHGGPNDYHFADGTLRARFLADCHIWAGRFSPDGADTPEPDGLWLDWHVHDRPFGRTAEAYLAAFQREMNELTSRADP